MNAAIQI